MKTQNSIVAFDPRDERKQEPAILAPRLATLDGKVIGLLSNNKPHSEELLRRIADIIGERYSIKGIVTHNKGGHQWPARREDLEKLVRKCDVAIHATAE
jgi:hypothetical protein